MQEPEILARLVRALKFAAEKHRYQRRKDVEASPFINHPIEVVDVLVCIGGVEDIAVLEAAALHDTVEDTATTPEELKREFGADVRALVEEVTDDTRLPKMERKRLQVEHAERLTQGAKQLKIADKICNVRDVTHNPPAGWPLQRRREYIDWTEAVVAGCRGVNPELEAHCDACLADARRFLFTDSATGG